MRHDFEDVLAAEHGALLRYATALAGDPEQAADMVQDVLVRAFQRWDAIATTERPGAYLTTMVTNEFLSWRRRWSTRNVSATWAAPPDRSTTAPGWPSATSSSDGSPGCPAGRARADQGAGAADGRRARRPQHRAPRPLSRSLRSRV